MQVNESDEERQRKEQLLKKKQSQPPSGRKVHKAKRRLKQGLNPQAVPVEAEQKSVEAEAAPEAEQKQPHQADLLAAERVDHSAPSQGQGATPMDLVCPNIVFISDAIFASNLSNTN